VLLEVCVASIEDALAAQAGGADRLELNAALELGGLTPSLGTLLQVKQAVSLPVVVMIRPRPGGFCYSAADFEVMQRDAALALEYGADGIAFGVLHEDGTVDVERSRRLATLAGSRQAVFHRAFDVTPEPFTALEQLIGLGVRRVLSSGQEATAYNGAVLLRRLIERAAGRIEVLPAGGINRFTLADVFERTGCDQVHASLRSQRYDPSTLARPQVAFGSAGLPEESYGGTCSTSVAALRALLEQS
jgi:copper homeostasis protein